MKALADDRAIAGHIRPGGLKTVEGLNQLVVSVVIVNAQTLLVGEAMVYAGRFMSRFAARGPLTERWLPLASSAVITVVGLTIALQSLATAGVLRIGL